MGMQLQVGQKIPDQLNQPAPPPKTPQIAKFAQGKDLPMPDPKLVAYFVQKYGIARKAAVLAYQEMARRLAAQNVDITMMQPAQVAQIITMIANHPKMKSQLQAPNPNMPQNSNPAPQSTATPQPVAARQQIAAAAPHMSEGGMTLPQGFSVVGDPHPTDPNTPNPEIIHNPTGAPVSVTPIKPSREQMKRFAAGTPMCHYDDGTPPDQLDDVEVTGSRPADQPIPAPVPSTTENNVREALAQQVLSHYGPAAVEAAFNKLKDQYQQINQNTSAPVMAGTPGEIASQQNALEATRQGQFNRAKDLAIGQLEAQQSGIKGGIDVANTAATGNQQQETHDLAAAKSRNDLTLQNMDLNNQIALNDPNHSVNQQIYQNLKAAGFNPPPGMNASQLALWAKTNEQTNKIVQDNIKAHADATNAAANSTNAATEAGKFDYMKNQPNNGSTFFNGQTLSQTPGNTTSQTQFADRVAGSAAKVPQLEQSFQKYADALKTATTDQNVSWGKNNPVGAVANSAKSGSTYALEQKFQALQSDNLAQAANQIGSGGELRLAGVDNSLMSVNPTVKEDKNVALTKVLTKMDQNIRLQHVASDLQDHAKKNPGSQGTDFKPDYSNKVAVWNPKTGEHSLIDRANLGEAEKRGFRDVSDGIRGFQTIRTQ